MICNQCPRGCNIDRKNNRGFCGVTDQIRLARASLHPWEEPCISGVRGSGTLFFAGCNLHCVYCQNAAISGGDRGKEISKEALGRIMLSLEERGAHNINLVTPSHYITQIAEVLKVVKCRLSIPVVFNCGGYESVEGLKRLEGLVDIYLPDIKYYSSERAQKYSHAADYFPVAMEALEEMLRQAPQAVFDGDGMMRRGVILRHLVLPGGRHDSIELLQRIKARFGTEGFLLSLMNQYTPEFAKTCPYPELHRRVTEFEYTSVLKEALALGFDGFLQDKSSAKAEYTPNFEEITF